MSESHQVFVTDCIRERVGHKDYIREGAETVGIRSEKKEKEEE